MQLQTRTLNIAFCYLPTCFSMDRTICKTSVVIRDQFICIYS
ncbi:hypothetical protein RchiOBHm_Chr5g0029671 [Rosa chinensis]|uniref:Uncharacterized protein n=1 Tax=Rosa chinensis TaxID=74649 RepID=A0A2P6Q9S4_ROSCH|nr:hypothetical protein RchiOBHm_Chr5g0029671 [Rosa chinensis]